jgi:hypothetical protein
VPLSEHEQRQLEQIEQALYAAHPRFARAVRAADPRVHYKRRVLYAAIGFLIGVALLPVGVSTNIAISIGGFILMLASCYWAASSYRRMNGIATGRLSVKERGPRRLRREAGDGANRKERRTRRRHGGGLGERLEQRWRRRQEGRDQ